MRRDDEAVYRCGAQAVGIIVSASLVLMLVAIAIVAYLTDGDIHG